MSNYNNTRYSVLISVYKNENPEYFQDAIKSMIKQSIKPDEIVIVEDGQLTDQLYDVIEKYVSTYPGLFNIVVNEQNLGLGLSLKKGLDACKNELVSRMDSDDISRTNRCEMQLKYMNDNREISIVGGQIEEFIETPDKPIGTRRVPLTDSELKKYMKRRCPFNHMTVMYRKSDVIKAGNYREWHFNEDYDLWIRMACTGLSFANLNKTLVDVRVGKDMYDRRGGMKYFISEAKIQKLMLSENLIGHARFLINVLQRFIVQILMPNRIRGMVFKMFARE